MSLRELSPKLVALICFFACGSWVAVNGIWVELPILVTKSPQQWALPSYLTVAIQLANVGPLFYMLCNKLVRLRGKAVVTEAMAIYVILVIGVLASGLLAFLWEKTTYLNGKEYSSSLIVLAFFLAIVSCTSSVTFLPFMATLPSQYMIVFYVGAGLSGLLPSITALIQGLGRETYACQIKVFQENVSQEITASNFSLTRSFLLNNTTKIVPFFLDASTNFNFREFFLFITVLMTMSLVSFCFLARAKYVVRRERYKSEESLNKITLTADHKPQNSPPVTMKITFNELCLLLVSNILINGIMNGVLPALQSYALIPYGTKIYHLTLTLSSVANPIGCFLYFFFVVDSVKAIVFGVIIYLISGSYTILMSTMSPCPILKDNVIGGILVVCITFL